MTFPTFPSSNGSATFNASFAAGLTITTEVGVGVVTGLSAYVNYSETCVAGESLTGTATGTATLRGTNVVGAALPMTIPFVWTRVGHVLVITSGVSIYGAALFLPTGGLPTCTGGSLTATIAGALVL